MSRLRRRCERRLENIPVPDPFDLDVFCAAVAAQRGRPLVLQPQPGLSADAPCGLWISVPTADYVCYDPGTSRLHAEHIVLHELSHMICGHTTRHGGDAMSRLVPDIDPRTIATMLGRAGYTSAQEREAEMLASLIRARSSAEPPAERLPSDTLNRVADVLTLPS